MIVKKGENNEENQFKRFNKLLDRKIKKPDFGDMTPYEIINYLREEDVRKNFKVLPSKRFLRRMVITSFCAIFIVSSYITAGSEGAIQRNVNLFVTKIESNKEFQNLSRNSLDYIIEGNFKTLIDSYRKSSNLSIDDEFELITMLSSINNLSQAKEELLKLKNKIQQPSFIKNNEAHKQNVYKLLDRFLLFNELDEAGNLLNKYRENEKEMAFIKRNIIYKFLSGNTQEAINIYDSISNESVKTIDDLVSYAKISVNFSRFDKAIESINEILNRDDKNIDVINIIEMMMNYDKDSVNKILNNLIEQNPENENLKLIRAELNSDDLSKTQSNIEDLNEFLKKHSSNSLTKIIRLDILLNASRDDEATRLIDEIKDSQEKTFESYYALSKYSLRMENFNDALNYAKESIKLNKDFYGNYDILLNALSSQNKSVNINYFYLKMKLIDLINTNTDKNFVKKYTDIFNDPNKAVDILEFANKISIFDADLKYKVAKIYIDQRNDNEAKEKLLEAIKLNPISIYYRTLGVLLVGMGEVESGIENIRKAYALDPEDILNLNNAGAYYANIEKNIPRAFSNVKAAYEGLNETYTQYEAFIIRENYFKLESIYNQATGDVLSDETPFIDYIY